MFRKIAETIRSGVRTVGSFARWIDNPYTGGKIRRPFSQKIASTGLSLLIIPLHKTLKVSKDIALAEIFNKIAYLINAILGVFSDLRRPGYNYLGFALRGLTRIAKGIGIGLIKVGKTLISGIGSLLR